MPTPRGKNLKPFPIQSNRGGADDHTHKPPEMPFLLTNATTSGADARKPNATKRGVPSIEQVGGKQNQSIKRFI